MPVRTVRQIPVDWTEGALIHVVSGISSRGYNGEEFFTACGLKLTSGTKWSDPEFDMPTCVRCLGTPKQCIECTRPLIAAKFPRDVAERCEGCAW
jgi:hypothetical protein